MEKEVGKEPKIGLVIETTLIPSSAKSILIGYANHAGSFMVGVQMAILMEPLGITTNAGSAATSPKRLSRVTLATSKKDGTSEQRGC